MAFVVRNSSRRMGILRNSAGDVLAPDSSYITDFARHPRLNVAISVFPNVAARGLLFLVLIPTLPLARATSIAQETPAPQQSPASFDDLATRAAAARDQQNLPLAIQLYSQAEQLKPDWQEGWWYLGVLQYSSNQYPAAIDAFTRLLQLVPTAVPAMALRGLCEFETAAYDDSLHDLEQAVAHGALNQPRNEQIIRYHLALLLAHSSRFQEALDQYHFFAEHQTDAPDLKIAIGLVGMRVASLPNEVSAQDRELYQAAGNAGYVFLSGDNEQADDLFARLFVRYPSTPNLHYFYGFLLFPHDPGLAIDQFHSELAVNPSNETANALLALTLVIAGRFSEALAPAQRAYSNAPDMEMSQLALGRSLAETGDRKRGEELLNQVIQRDPNSLEAHLGLVSIYSQGGNREEAARERKVCRDLAK
jgi:cytochrome c-type biogenesis protein CcmH/NrfG